MKKQIVVIHGGNAFETYEEYLQNLQTKYVSLEKLRFKDWKRNLGEKLGEEFDVIFPQMPNSQNARYLEWKIWFERFIPLLNDTVIFIGHSLGGIFLAKYFSENTFLKKIAAVFLVAAPHNSKGIHPLVDFIISDNLEKFNEQAEAIILYHSTDDTVVPFSNSESYKNTLPKAKIVVFNDRQHFNQETFPEIIEEIKSLYKD